MIYFCSSKNFNDCLDEGLKANNLPGTIWYSPPETFVEKEYGANFDIWCLGITLMEILDKDNPIKFQLPYKEKEEDYTTIVRIQKYLQALSPESLVKTGMLNMFDNNHKAVLLQIIKSCLSEKSSRPISLELLEQSRHLFKVRTDFLINWILKLKVGSTWVKKKYSLNFRL